MTATGRLTRENWIAAARKTLVGSGIDDVKVDLLARRLKVTRGSFYWHFRNRQDLLDALLDHWGARNRDEMAAIEAPRGANSRPLVELFRIWLGQDASFPAFDIAIRVWARKSKSVAELVREVDDGWIALFQASLERSGMRAPESMVRARIIYFHQVGYFALSLDESRAERARLAPFYYEILTGEPAPDDMADTLLAGTGGRARPGAGTGKIRQGGEQRRCAP